jgi:hypothetical protein
VALVAVAVADVAVEKEGKAEEVVAQAAEDKVVVVSNELPQHTSTIPGRQGCSVIVIQSVTVATAAMVAMVVLAVPVAMVVPAVAQFKFLH